MIISLIITAVLLVGSYLIYKYAIAPAPFDNVIKWLMSAIGVIIVVVILFQIWGVPGIYHV